MPSRADFDVISQPSASAPVEELDCVRLTRDLIVPEGSFAAGSAGTVVHVYEDGETFEVEFSDPAPAVVAIERTDVERLSD